MEAGDDQELNMSRPRAVVCLSGGMDSSVCAALAARDYEVYAVHFSYGQRTEARELRSAQEVARIIGVQGVAAAEDRPVPADWRVGADRSLRSRCRLPRRMSRASGARFR